MVDQRSKVEKVEKLEHPANYYPRPQDIAEDQSLSLEEKKQALSTWEQDARQMLTASNEGMPGSKDGHSADDHHRLGEVLQAKEKIGAKPKRKLAH